jgi:acyl-coenzyme A synthetase/AMP-(fatty) acid ligase
MSALLHNSFFCDRILSSRLPGDVLISYAGRSLTYGDFAESTCLGDRKSFAGRSVMITSSEPYDCALALCELDGVASRIVICPPGLPIDHISTITELAAIDTLIVDPAFADHRLYREGLRFVEVSGLKYPRCVEPLPSLQTEWVLLTSGTTGVAKMVSHTFATLTINIRRPDTAGEPITWASFNDMRRFSGLQMFLHAMLTDSTLVLKPVNTSVADFLPVLEAAGATHVSGTPTHWRKVLMFAGRKNLKLQQITLVGEIADQSILDSLRDAFPHARLTHIYGSTESGTGFSVHDGKVGFPSNFVGRDLKGLELRVDDGMLKVKSNRAALNYVGTTAAPLHDANGFIETGDQVELVGDRYRFLGRKNGAVNIGGSRVHPEEVEAALNADPRVSMSVVSARKNPFTGSILVADVVLHDASQTESALVKLASDLRALLRGKLDAYKVPATIRFVPDLVMSNAGKLERRGG